ncbi:hypothetical protein [Limosilactobacillus gorillae]|uniref:hypothetical protein n=1 Tax=Limosilactobacillus gorillae TaxID=1450649 RepID=UPI000A438F81|nr:hypothetical protein [Limosilactobacillus gorillae]
MEFQINQYAFVFEEGKVIGAHVGFYARYDADGQSSNNVVLVKASDLPEGQTFFTTSMTDVLTIAKKKLVDALNGTKTDTTQPQAQV